MELLIASFGFLIYVGADPLLLNLPFIVDQQLQLTSVLISLQGAMNFTLTVRNRKFILRVLIVSLNIHVLSVIA